MTIRAKINAETGTAIAAGTAPARAVLPGLSGLLLLSCP
jgi:hypothetical protein